MTSIYSSTILVFNSVAIRFNLRLYVIYVRDQNNCLRGIKKIICTNHMTFLQNLNCSMDAV